MSHMGKTTITVFMADEVKAAVKELADSEQRSLSQMASILIQEGLERRREKSQQKPPG